MKLKIALMLILMFMLTSLQSAPVDSKETDTKDKEEKKITPYQKPQIEPETTTSDPVESEDNEDDSWELDE